MLFLLSRNDYRSMIVKIHLQLQNGVVFQHGLSLITGRGQ